MSSEFEEKGVGRPEKSITHHTSIDLGEDLLGDERDHEAKSTAAPRNDDLKSSDILLNEGMVEEAKKILFKLLRQDPHDLPARQRLAKIHELELQQALGRQPASRQRSRDRPAEETDFNRDDVLRSLDKDFHLGILEEASSEGYGVVELSLFKDGVSLEAFGDRLEREMTGSQSSDRMDLGIGFLQMGLFKLAERQFRAATAQDSRARLLLAHTLIEGGKPFDAILVIEAAANDPELSGEDQIHLDYYRGLAQEKQGRLADALTAYQKVTDRDAEYRDTSDRIRVLNGRVSGKC